MAPKYVFNYFDTWGAGECIRLLLSYGQVEFTDNRVTTEEWPKLKPKTPNGQLPTLEVDGKLLNQSSAICRYLGKEFGIGGSNNWEAAQIDAVVDNVSDLKSQLKKVYECKDAAEKKKLKETFLTEIIPLTCNKLETRLKNNNGHVNNGKLSWGDIYLVSFLDILEEIIPENLKKASPLTVALQKKVHELPGIKEWVEKRAPNNRSIAKMLE